MADPSTDFGNSIATNATNTGNNAINSFDPNATANNIRGNFNTLNNSQTSSTNDFLAGYKATIAGQPNLADMYSKFGAANNLPALKDQSTYLNNQVLQVPQSNLNLANGFNYSQGQVDQKTNQDLTKLQPLASAATNAFQNAQNLTNQQVGYQQTQNQYELQPVQAQQQMLTDQYARQMTGFTTASEAELNGLIAKMQSGVALSTAEMSRANALASAQATYQSAVTSAQASQNVANIGNQYKILPAGDTLANTVTGGTYRAR